MIDDKKVTAGIEALELGRLGGALREVDAYLVGGAARSMIRGEEPGGDIDIAVDGDIEPLIAGFESAGRHDRFGTATVPLSDGRHVDLARTRTEQYPEPGALPVVSPASIEEDLARRDFTVNAIAIGLNPPIRILDPFEGAADLAAGRLRALHDGSFTDDPTRAIRAARYCARLGLEPEDRTRRLLGKADLGLVTPDRRDAELVRLAREPEAGRGFALLVEWDILAVPQGSLELVDEVDRTLEEQPFERLATAREAAVLLATGDGRELAVASHLAAETPQRPSRAVALAAGVAPAVLLLAAAQGARWVGRYLSEWEAVRLEIDGNDLIAAGISPGPAVGAGLRGALDRKLDGEITGGREGELEAALEIARGAD